MVAAAPGAVFNPDPAEDVLIVVRRRVGLMEWRSCRAEETLLTVRELVAVDG